MSQRLVVPVLVDWLPAVLYRCRATEAEMQSWRVLYTDLYHQPTHTHLFVHACVHTRVVAYMSARLGLLIMDMCCSIYACCNFDICVCFPTISWVLEGRGELLGCDPRHATLLLGFLSCSHRCLCFTLCMSRPDTEKDRKYRVQ